MILGRALTLIESNRSQDRANAEKLVEEILPQTGKSIRIGITGAPGVGKSTFIEVFGKYITSLGMKIAVLTIDPSSQKSKGSILGDKTRMDELSKDPLAFIRPTAAGGTLGGVAMATRESILLCEAAGYEVIIVETVGVGQSEVAVRGMVDFFLLLMLAGAGDELQGIKKGIMEMADGIVIAKSEGDNAGKAKQAQADFQHALHLFQASESGWLPPVLTTSAVAKTGIKETWQMIELFRVHAAHNGFFEAQRRQQQMAWFYAALDELIKNKILNQSKRGLASIEKQILTYRLSPNKGAREVLKQMKL
jgi:LAO/AO transport system kinase